jgi:hypothetical protein
MPLSPETIARVRQDYADGVPVAQICTRNKVSSGVAYKCVDGIPPGADRLPPIPRRQSRPPRRPRTPVASRKALVARLWRSAKNQVHEVEERLARADQPPPERERDARLLAVLVKTLRELTALDRAQNDQTATKDAPRDDDDAVPRDLDELRRELARRVDLLRQRREPAGPAGGTSA